VTQAKIRLLVIQWIANQWVKMGEFKLEPVVKTLLLHFSNFEIIHIRYQTSLNRLKLQVQKFSFGVIRTNGAVNFDHFVDILVGLVLRDAIVNILKSLVLGLIAIVCIAFELESIQGIGISRNL
jgi:hypothetical protein